MKFYDLEQYEILFKQFPDKLALAQHFNVLKFGTRIGLNYRPLPRLTNNNPKFNCKELLGIGSQLRKWLKTGIVIGPIDETYARQRGITLNQLFGVPKPDGSTRPILNLSDDNLLNYSINDLLDEDWCSVEYIQTHELVQIVSALGVGAYLWAHDLRDGYYNVSVHLSDIHNLGFQFDGKIYLFQRLPMGLSSSPKIFTDFMFFTLWAIKHNRPDLHFITVVADVVKPEYIRVNSEVVFNPFDNTITLPVLLYYLDDILGGHNNQQTALQQFKHTKEILQLLSLDTKDSKSKPPKQQQVWLGKIFDTNRQTLSLPKEKVTKYIREMKVVKSKRSITKRNLLSHIGRTRHMATIYKSLAAFARNLEVYAHSVKELHHFIHINKALRSDLDLCIWGMKQASTFGVPFEFFLKPREIPEITITTDASSLVGVGGFDDKGSYFQHKWTEVPHFEKYPKRDINWMELAAIFVIIHHSASTFKNKTIHIYTDNKPVKHMLIKMRSKLNRPDLQRLINEICRLSIQYQFHFWIDHIPGSQNEIADGLSRFIDSQQYNDKLSNEINVLSSLIFACELCKDVIIELND